VGDLRWKRAVLLLSVGALMLGIGMTSGLVDVTCDIRQPREEVAAGRGPPILPARISAGENYTRDTIRRCTKSPPTTWTAASAIVYHRNYAPHGDNIKIRKKNNGNITFLMRHRGSIPP
jgi:hypothetical protein